MHVHVHDLTLHQNSMPSNRRRAPPKKRSFTDYFSSSDEESPSGANDCVVTSGHPVQQCEILSIHSPAPTTSFCHIRSGGHSQYSSSAAPTLGSSSSPSWPLTASQRTDHSNPHTSLATQQLTPNKTYDDAFQDHNHFPVDPTKATPPPSSKEDSLQIDAQRHGPSLPSNLSSLDSLAILAEKCSNIMDPEPRNSQEPNKQFMLTKVNNDNGRLPQGTTRKPTTDDNVKENKENSFTQPHTDHPSIDSAMLNNQQVAKPKGKKKRTDSSCKHHPDSLYDFKSSKKKTKTTHNLKSKSLSANAQGTVVKSTPSLRPKENSTNSKSLNKERLSEVNDAVREGLSQQANRSETFKTKNKSIEKHQHIPLSDSKVPKIDPTIIAQNVQRHDATENTKKTTSTKESGGEKMVKSTDKLKKKKLNFQDRVLKHMLMSFKPFTLKTLALEINSTETQLDYVMLSLIDKALISKKTFNSAKSGRSKTLYWALYGARAKEVSALIASSEDIESAKRQLSSLRGKAFEIKQELNDAESQVSNEELDMKIRAERERLVHLSGEIDNIKARIQATQPKGVSEKRMKGPPRSKEELAREQCPLRMKTRINHMRKEWVERKAKCTDLIEQMAEGMEQKPKQIVKLLDVETDEMVGVKLPPKRLQGT